MASIGVPLKKGRIKGIVDPSRMKSDGTTNLEWSPLLSDEQIKELLDILRGYRPSLNQYQFNVFKEYATGIRQAQYEFFKKPEHAPFVKMMLHAFGQLNLGDVILEADDIVSKFVTPNGHINSTVDGLSFVPDTIPSKREGGKARKKRMSAEDADILALHALTDESTRGTIIVYGTARERRMLENAINRLQKYLPAHEQRKVINPTPFFSRLNPMNALTEMIVDVNGEDNRAFKRLFGNAVPPRKQFAWNPLAGLKDMIWTPAASAFSSSRSIKPTSIVPSAVKVAPAVSDAANAVVIEAMATEKAAFEQERETAYNEPIDGNDEKSFYAKAMKHSGGALPMPLPEELPAEDIFLTDFEAGLAEVHARMEAGEMRNNVVVMNAAEHDGDEEGPATVAHNPVEIEGALVTAVAQSLEPVTTEPPRESVALPAEETPAPVIIPNTGRITGLSRISKQLVINMVCQNPEMFQARSVQSLNAIISAIPGMEDRDNTQVCIATAKLMQQRGLVKLAEVNGELVIEKVVSVVSPNKYFNTVLAQSIAPHKDFWVGQGVETMQVTLQHYWGMDEDAASYVAKGIWQEMKERNVFALDADGKVERVADISSVPPLRQAYAAAAKMPPMAVPVSEQVRAFDDATSQIPVEPSHDGNDTIDQSLVAEAANDYSRQGAADIRRLAAE